MPKILHFGTPALNVYRNDWNRNNEQLFYRSNSQIHRCSSIQRTNQNYDGQTRKIIFSKKIGKNVVEYKTS